MTTRTMGGCRGLIRYNGQPVGYTTNFSWTEVTNYQPIELIGNVAVSENTPLGYTVSANASMFRTFADGTMSGIGSLKTQGIFPKEKDILTTVGAEVLLFDSVTGKPMAQILGVKASTTNYTAPARGVIGVDVGFVALRVRDESEVVVRNRAP